jgi:hypothetical protein
MTLKAIAAFVVVVMVSLAVGQVEHAPTVAQCQADQRLWLSKIEEGDSQTLAKFDVLSQWNTEMIHCQKVDPTHSWDYNNLAGEISATQAARMLHFIQRHDMWQKFVSEDAAGQR